MHSGVFVRVLILSALTDPIPAQKPAPEVFTLVVPHGPILTQINASISLPCELSPIFSAEPLEVCWYRPGNFNRPALLYKDHSIQASMDPRYWGRVSLTGGLERGNVSLRLERVTLEDRGEYVCHVSSEHWYEKAKVSLTLIARGSGGQVNVTCSSVGWSPQPTVTWRNKEGKEIRNGQEVLYTSDSQGLVSVSSWLLYSRSDSDWLSCTVSLSEEKKRESRILPQICQPGPWREAFIAYLVLSLLLLSALASVVIMLGKQRNSLARLSSQKSKGSPAGTELEQRPETRHLIEEAGHIHEKQAVEEGINLKDWLQVKGFKKNVTMDAQTAHLAFNVSDEGKKAQYSTGEANNSSNKHPHVLDSDWLSCTVSLSEEKKRESRILPQICQPETRHLIEEAGHIHEKQAVEEGINLKDWLQVKGFKKNVTMDAQTAHLAFNANDEGKKAQYSTGEANNSSNKHPHVLGKERLISGQHYWEVKMGDNCTEKLSWYIGVARENAQRKPPFL
ncbi:hypothetical protein J4Q44_G00043250 [Coregonus suidteri]|uniref:Uncharacterized protein n=1 Tax=Coregonus suidteri TaxID=861788 RepID=A0AAN8ME21_9TELE